MWLPSPAAVALFRHLPALADAATVAQIRYDLQGPAALQPPLPRGQPLTLLFKCRDLRASEGLPSYSSFSSTFSSIGMGRLGKQESTKVRKR